jgi:hypothetical protein
MASENIKLRSGEHTTTLKKLPAARFTRVAFGLSTPVSANTSPVLASVELTGEPDAP